MYKSLGYNIRLIKCPQWHHTRVLIRTTVVYLLFKLFDVNNGTGNSRFPTDIYIYIYIYIVFIIFVVIHLNVYASLKSLFCCIHHRHHHHHHHPLYIKPLN